VADDKNDQSLGSQTIGAADGKDVLYGWLVGRAAADLGLAQAIAASEAQRAEQIKRLEAALLGQMRELQNSQATVSGPFVDGAEVGRLKDRVEQFGERQNFLEAQQLTMGQIEAQLSAKITELQAQTAQSIATNANPEINALRADITVLTQRLGQAEARARRESAPLDGRLAEEQIAVVVHQQTEALKSQLVEQLHRQTSAASDFKALETSFLQKFDALQQEIREKAALVRLRDGELSDLRIQIAGVAQRLDCVAAPVPVEPSASEREAERALWQRDFDERLTARLRELGDEIRGKLHGITGSTVDQEQFRGETQVLTARIAELEQCHHEAHTGAAAEAREAFQATVALRGELAALKTALLEAQRVQPTVALIPNVEAMLRGEIHELRDQIAQNHHGTLEWENQFKELHHDIQSLMQRQIQSESLAQQTLALVTQETAQIRAGLSSDLVTIETQLNERRAHDAALQSMEEALNLRLRELQSELAQGTLAHGQRDRELRDLKNQVQLLVQQIGQFDPAALLKLLGRRDPVSASPAVSGDIMPALQPIELRPAAPARTTDTTANLFQPSAPINGYTPEQSKTSATDLHDRLSAEIERKRAELREKSGRWKVRQ